MQTRNVTLALPVELLQRAKRIAFERETSLSGLLVELLEELSRQEDAYAAAMEDHLEILRYGFDLGTRGQISWSREEAHERR